MLWWCWWLWFFNIIKCSMLKFVVILNAVFTILQKKVKIQINEKIYTNIKWNVLKKNYKIIGVHWHKDTIMNQLNIHGLYICVCVIFKAQINYLWFLEEFKVSEILHVIIFDIICTFTYGKNYLHYTIHFLIFLHWSCMRNMNSY